MAEKQTITITIEGPPASGKSAIAQTLAEALRDYNFMIDVQDGRDGPRPPGGLAAALLTCAKKTSVAINTKHSPPGAIDQAIDALMRDSRGSLVLLIMPRDLGKDHPDCPRGHSSAWARADVVAEWRDGEFQICKSRNGSTTPGAQTYGTKTQD